jgi:hypothetical protein
MNDGGDCYAAAGELFMDSQMWGGPQDLTLVHGRPTLTRPPFIKYGHAWVEFEAELEGHTVQMVRDVSNGKDVLLPRAAYYRVGKIDPEECNYYQYEDFRHWVKETGHWGPWEGIESDVPGCEAPAARTEEAR